MDAKKDTEFEIIETLHDSDNSTIYLAKHPASGNNVVLKQSKNSVKTGLYNEYTLIKQHAGEDSNIKLTQFGKTPVLQRQYYPGKSLKKELENISGPDFFFQYCFKIITALKKIHENEIIHKDLSADNILINNVDNSVHIIDLELSTKQQFQQYSFSGASIIEGTLQYMSPEQTGRMNRIIDYRSDFYSLGVIFYEMLTGKRPFESKDALELIHCHIAVTPTPMSEVSTKVPEVLNTVVNKLMAKNAEERYQSLSGLYVDLEHCMKEWKSTGTIAPFKLAKADLPLRLNISQRLVGREPEIDKVFDLFETAASGKKILLELKGLSGLGKTMLIREIARPLTYAKGTYVSGKFDSLQRTVPYYAWTQALNQLAELLLTENPEYISRCKKLLAENMKGLEADIVAIAPKWKSVFSETVPLPLLSPKEQQGRVKFALSLFLKSIMKVVKPLLVFIDDWQWADEASIELLKSIASDEMLGKLFLAMAYRHNETDSTHPFIRCLEEIRSGQVENRADENMVFDTITLQALTVDNTSEIISETFTCSKEEAKELGNLIHSKTKGNPFFINQLLDYLYNKKQIRLDEKEYKWRWDLKAIEKLGVTDDIATVIIEKINDISAETTHALTYASCLGNEFSLSSLHYLTKIDKSKLHTLLWEAIKENIIEPLEKDYKFVPEYYEENKTNIKFRFTHDRIQQALYNRAEVKLREELNFNAAEFEMAHPGEAENIFITANHLLASGKLIGKIGNKKLAAQLLLEAGQKAFASAAYESSYIFLDLFAQVAGSEKLISITDYCLLIQSSYLNNHPEKAKIYQDQAFSEAKDKIERSKIYEAMLKGMIAMNILNEAILVARKSFEELGFKIPATKATKGQIIWSAIKTQIVFPDKKIKEIGQFPDMKDENGKALMRIMFHSLAAFFFVERDTYPLLIFKMVRLSKKLGNTPESIIGYGSYGLILAGVLNKAEAGYNMGQEAMKLFEKYDAPHLLSSAGFVDTGFILHWKQPLVSFENDCLRYYEKGMNTGNLEYAAWNLYTHSSSVFFRGNKTSEMAEMFANYEKFYLNHKQMNAYGTSLVLKNAINRTLRSEQITIADTAEEKALFEKESKANNSVYLFVYDVSKLFLGLFHGDNATVLKNALQGQKDIENAASLYWQPFFRALKTSVYINCVFEGKLDYEKIKKELKADKKKLQIAHTFYDGNVGWIMDLIEAETQAYEKKTINHALYTKAKEKALKHEFHFPAILIDLMRIQKMSYLKQKDIKKYWEEVKEKISEYELNSVIYAWENKYPELKGAKMQNTAISQTQGKMTSEEFDVQTIIKTTQALSAEIVLSKLTDKMMHFAMENAGANYGCFLIKKEGAFTLASEKFAGGDSKKAGSNGIPDSIFNYVLHSGEPLILDDAMSISPYNKDQKVITAKEQSVMCIPIINQNTTIGVLYLSNQLSKGVFTEQRIGLIKMLAGQMGVSLQNALLYEHMEQLVAMRTAEVVEQKNVIQEKAAELAERHKEITDSINYAERIQRALLANRQLLDENLREYFILFKPKGVVSGDFYWATKLLNNNFMIVTADSTGHGVAGAIMSIVNIACLKEAVSKDIMSPDKLLNETRKLVIESLKYDGSSEGGKDGMDATVISFDFKNNMLHCAGAMNPIWVVRGNELTEIRGDRFPIGKHDMNTATFTLNSYPIQKGDMVYTLTDGFPDQFGGPKGRKFMNKQLKELLLAVSKEPAEVQRQKLDAAFTSWTGATEQVDDVTVVGIRI